MGEAADQQPIRVVLVEDSRILRDSLADMLREQPDVEVVGALGTREKAVEIVRTQAPDVLLLDIGLRSAEAVRVIASVHESMPDVRIVVMDLLPVRSDTVDFIKAGADAFILKEATFDDFLSTLRAVARGENVLPPPMATSLFEQILMRAARLNVAEFDQTVALTRREREVVDCVAAGMSNKEIATELSIATQTVKTHVHNILQKLAFESRLEIAAFAHRQRVAAHGAHST